MKKILKKIGIWFVILNLLFLFSNLVGAPIVYNILFDRYESENQLVEPGVLSTDLANLTDYQEIEFKSNGQKLYGRYFKNNTATKTILVSHGIHSTSNSLLNVVKYFYDNNYSVFSYDNAGCGKSSGRVNGFTSSLVDMKNALDYLDTIDNNDKILFGFSWGGFASAAILNYDLPSVKGIISISGYNDSSKIIVNKGVDYVGPLVLFGKIPVEAIQKSRYGSLVNYTCVNGLNKSLDTKAFIAHAKNDDTIRLNRDSIYKNSSKIKNTNVTYYLAENRGHSDILYSDDAIEYQKLIDEKLKKFKNRTQKMEYLANECNASKYSELNENLFNNILAFTNAI